MKLTKTLVPTTPNVGWTNEPNTIYLITNGSGKVYLTYNGTAIYFYLGNGNLYTQLLQADAIYLNSGTAGVMPIVITVNGGPQVFNVTILVLGITYRLTAYASNDTAIDIPHVATLQKENMCHDILSRLLSYSPVVLYTFNDIYTDNIPYYVDQISAAKLPIPGASAGYPATWSDKVKRLCIAQPSTSSTTNILISDTLDEYTIVTQLACDGPTPLLTVNNISLVANTGQLTLVYGSQTENVSCNLIGVTSLGNNEPISPANWIWLIVTKANIKVVCNNVLLATLPIILGNDLTLAEQITITIPIGLTKRQYGCLSVLPTAVTQNEYNCLPGVDTTKDNLITVTGNNCTQTTQLSTASSNNVSIVYLPDLSSHGMCCVYLYAEVDSVVTVHVLNETDTSNYPIFIYIDAGDTVQHVTWLHIGSKVKVSTVSGKISTRLSIIGEH